MKRSVTKQSFIKNDSFKVKVDGFPFSKTGMKLFAGQV